MAHATLEPFPCSSFVWLTLAVNDSEGCFTPYVGGNSHYLSDGRYGDALTRDPGQPCKSPHANAQVDTKLPADEVIAKPTYPIPSTP